MKSGGNVIKLRPIDKGSLRPIRIWIANQRRIAQHLNFVNEYKAHMRALIEADQAKVGTTLEVFNITNGKLLATYTTVVGGVKSWHSTDMKYLIRLESKAKKLSEQ